MRKGVVQEFPHPETVDGRMVEPRDEFAANAVPRIILRFEKRDWDASLPKREPERKAGQAAADDFDGKRRFQGHLMAIPRAA